MDVDRRKEQDKKNIAELPPVEDNQPRTVAVPWSAAAARVTDGRLG